MSLRGLASAVFLVGEQGDDGVDVQLKIWNHSFDDPETSRRSSLIKWIFLTDLPRELADSFRPGDVVDRYGVVWTPFFTPVRSLTPGWEGYAEYDCGGCIEDGPSVLWAAESGVYDERSVGDDDAQAIRQPPKLHAGHGIPVPEMFNYVVGPVTFQFRLAEWSGEAGVRLGRTFIGGTESRETEWIEIRPAEGLQ